MTSASRLVRRPEVDHLVVAAADGSAACQGGAVHTSSRSSSSRPRSAHEQRLQVQLGDVGDRHAPAVDRVAHVHLAARLRREPKRHARPVERERLDGELAKCLLPQQDEPLIGHHDPQRRVLALAGSDPAARRRLDDVLAGREVGGDLTHQAAPSFLTRPLGGLVQLFTHPEPFLPAGPSIGSHAETDARDPTGTSQPAATRRPGPAFRARVIVWTRG